MKSADKLKDFENARSVIYRRLADALQLPGAGHSKSMEELIGGLQNLGSQALGFARRLPEAFSAGKNDKPSLEVEYTRLFIGPFLGPAPPFGSVYLEQGHRLMGESTMDARRHYLSLGLDLAADVKEAPDHISIELEFMYALIRQCIPYITADDCDAYWQNVSRQRLFLENHLSAWIPAFSDKILEHTRMPYFRLLALILRTFILEDLEVLWSATRRLSAEPEVKVAT